eukprot:SAG11_NODE_25326_length_360_cov_0.846743_1_plen_42_part_01
MKTAQEPEAGGETHFPRAGGLPPPNSFLCEGQTHSHARMGVF